MFSILMELFNGNICSLLGPRRRLGQIGNFLSGIGGKKFFLALGMGLNLGPKNGLSRAVS